ncbi:peptide deformylase [Photobacterium sp. TY1-4]|uniref:peptide deformylase n=1 Tax=Photobacterium sp. TY1-4 TaxID=2899122 RepID=UPI0021C1DA5B|nr:peptide deformylase [Photobacterium sp. TY1-4]UXI03319.1 peptide deformylase [Photobacterium sp. TY1-4]
MSVTRYAEILQLGNPLLRQLAAPLTPAQFKEHTALFRSLAQIMHEHQGVGIAAPQIGASVRAFIVASNPNPRYPDAPLMPPTLMLNPQLVWAGDTMVKDWEGCLSIPGMRARVSRHREIDVSYTTLAGETVQARLSDFVARIFQHELDHLDGIVFLDRATPQDYATEAEYRKQIAGPGSA